MTQSQKENAKIRIVLGPIAKELLGDVTQAERAAELDRAIEDLQEQAYGHYDASEVGTSPAAEIARMQGTIRGVLKTQNEMIAFLADRFDHLEEHQRTTRGLIAAMLTEGDDRLLVLERMEEVVGEQKAALNTLTSRVKRGAKQRSDHQRDMMEQHIPVAQQQAPEAQPDLLHQEQTIGDYER